MILIDLNSAVLVGFISYTPITIIINNNNNNNNINNNDNNNNDNKRDAVVFE